tara:strand:- start:173 stop:403 length:231 start_codon:yes stop_codon:yes gene_type:complete
MTARAFAYRASIINRPTGGGNKKSGLPPSVGKGIFSLNRAYGSPAQRRKVYFINQLGWTGGRFYQTRGPSDGVKRK